MTDRYFVTGAFKTDPGVFCADTGTALDVAEKRSEVWGHQRIVDTRHDYKTIVTVHADWQPVA